MSPHHNMTSIRLVDADVVIQDADTVLNRATVLIENGAIKQVIAAGRTEATSDGTQTIDCRGLMLLPGLVNSHTHLYQVLMRGLGKDATVREWVQRVTYPRARILSRAQYYDAV